MNSDLNSDMISMIVYLKRSCVSGNYLGVKFMIVYVGEVHDFFLFFFEVA